MEKMDEPMEVDLSPMEETKTIDDKINNIEQQESQIHSIDNRYQNREGNFTTGVDVFSKEERMKMEERAKRFGLKDNERNPAFNQEQDLYASMGIAEDNENSKNLRPNVIHMRGTEDMSTQDVFKYFKDYAPASIEWINDVSCNVVWLDNVTAARALLGLSRKIINTQPQNKNGKKEQNPVDDDNGTLNQDNINSTNTCTKDIEEVDDKHEEGEIDVKNIECPLPPGLWRKGIDHPKSKGIFLRFATRNDKKQPNAEKMSDYYKKYGNPNFGGVKGILTDSRKRLYKQVQREKKFHKFNNSNDVDTSQSKNPWGALSQQWGDADNIEEDYIDNKNIRAEGSNVKNRLGVRTQPKDFIEPVHTEISSDSESEEEWCKRSKIMRMRMHADDEEKKVQNRKRNIKNQIVFNKLDKVNDLRTRITNSKRELVPRGAIKVVITNTNIDSWKNETNSEEEDGEIVDTEDSNDQNFIQSIEEGEEDEKNNELSDEEYESDDSSRLQTQEVQGPMGSVIKVVPQKPKLASTVWARLNHVKSEVNDATFKQRSIASYNSRQNQTHDLRSTLKNDLRSRIGKKSRGRSPLRIEVKNDKYKKTD